MKIDMHNLNSRVILWKKERRNKAALERQQELRDQGSGGSASDEESVLESQTAPALTKSFVVHVEGASKRRSDKLEKLISTNLNSGNKQVTVGEDKPVYVRVKWKPKTKASSTAHLLGHSLGNAWYGSPGKDLLEQQETLLDDSSSDEESVFNLHSKPTLTPRFLVHVESANGINPDIVARMISNQVNTGQPQVNSGDQFHLFFRLDDRRKTEIGSINTPLFDTYIRVKHPDFPYSPYSRYSDPDDQLPSSISFPRSGEII